MSLTTVRHIFGRLFDTLFGNPDHFALEQRLFNACALAGAAVISAAGVINLFLDIELWLRLFPLAVAPLFLTFYYFGRHRDTYEGLIWPMVALILVGLAVNWVGNGGSRGPITMFFVVAAAACFLLVHGVGKLVVTFLFIAVPVVLHVAEHRQLEWFGHEMVRPYPSQLERTADLIVALTLCMGLAVAILHVVSRNFHDVFEKLQDYKTHFYEDLVLARILQRRIYEYDAETLRGYNHELVYLPSAELSGDLYDFSRDDGRLRIFLADSKGHGINSSLSAMIIKSEWMSLNRIHLPPDEAMQLLNERIIQRYGDSISFSAVIVDLEGAELSYASAGHVVQYTTDGKLVRELDATGAPVGLIEESAYRRGTVPFSPDSKLLLFTDALTEETDLRGKPVGTDWLRRLFLERGQESPEDLARETIRELAKRKGQRPESLSCRDDLTLIVIGLE